MKIRSVVAVSMCGAGLTLGGFARAEQVQKTPAQKPSAAEVGHDPHHSHSEVNDHMIASCLAIENQEEIAIAKFAEGKAHNPKVKEFAAMIAKDHATCLQKLEKFAPEAAKDGYLMQTASENTPRSNENRAAVDGKSSKKNQTERTEARNEPADAKSGHAGHTTAMLNLHRELAQECLSQSKHSLSQKDGLEFDECFMGHQIAKHAGMKAQLTVFQRHVTGDLHELVAEGLQATEKHLKKAEEIMKSLKNSNSNSKTTADAKN